MAKKAVVGSLVVELTANTVRFVKGMQRADKRLQNFKKRAVAIGGALSRNITLPMLAAGGASVKFAVDFNRSMANVATLIPQNTARVEQLKRSVQDLAIETGKSTSDLAGGLYQVVSAFGDGADTAERLRIVAQGAVAGVASTTDSLNLLSAVTKGYGDTSSAAMQRVSDLAFMTVKLGQTTFPELAASMGLVTGQASEMAVSQEELFASFAALTGVTGSTAEVGTQLSGVLTAMMKPTEEMKAAITGLGYANAEAMISALGFQGSLVALSEAADGDKEALAKMFGRVQGLRAALALAGSQSDKYANSLSDMQSAAGATSEAYREQTEGINKLGHSLARLKQRFMVMAQELGDSLAPAVEWVSERIGPLTNLVRNLISAFQSLSPETQRTVGIVLAFVAALGPTITAVGVLGGMVGKLIPIIGALVSPWGLLIAALAAVGAAVYVWRDEIWGAMKSAYNAVKGWMVDKLKPVWDWIKGALDKVAGWFRSLVAAIGGLLARVGIDVGKIGEAAYEGVKDFTEGAADLAKETGGRIRNEWQNIVAAIRSKWGELTADTRSEMETVIDAVDNAATVMVPRVGAAVRDASKKVREFADEMRDMVEVWKDDFTDAIVDMVMTGKASFADFANSVIRDILRIYTKMALIEPLTGWLSNIAGGGGGGTPSVGIGPDGGAVLQPMSAVPMQVNITNNAGEMVKVSATPTAGGASIVIDSAIHQFLASGKADGVMSARYGANRRPVGR